MMNDKDGFGDAEAVVASGVTGGCTWEVSGEPEEYTLVIDEKGDTSDNSHGWGKWRDGIKTVIIRGGMAGIDGRAFEECERLTSIHVDVANKHYSSADGVLFNKGGGKLLCYPRGRGGDYAIPGTVTAIGRWAFARCRELTGVRIPDSVTKIGELAFCRCDKLSDVTIPVSVTRIGREVFFDCSGLTSVTIRGTVTRIDDRDMFSRCHCLTSVTIPCSVARINRYVFSMLPGLTSIQVDAANKRYSSADGVLFEKSGRKLLCCPEGKGGDYAIPGTVTAIDHGAFARCRALTGVRIPASVTAIGQGVFTGSRLNFIHVEAANTRFSSVDGVLFNKDKSKLICCPARKKGDYAIPDTVTEIGKEAFFWCNGLTSVTIPGSVITIGSHAFTFCVLTTVTIPDSVVTVGAWAFGPFNNKLTSVTIGKSMTGDYLFWDCEDLISIRVDAANAWLCSEDGVLFDKEKKTLLCYPGGRAGDYAIPGSVTAIGDYAFEGCKGLTSVVIPGSVTAIGNCAFEGCTGLTSVVISDSVTAIGRDAFNSCTGLTSVTIPGSVTVIGDGAFNGCFGLTSVVIPGSVTTIGDNAFSSCNGLTSVVIHDSVTAIGRSAFRFCRCLTSVVIPGSVTTIGESAFGYSSLSTFTNFSLVPQEIDRCFDNVDVDVCTLRVPAGAVGAYKAAAGWGEFGKIVAIEDES